VTFDQAEFAVRCEWDLGGLRSLAPISDVVVVVDVLSFSTAVEIGVNQAGVIFPYPLKGVSAVEYARSVNANLACDRGFGFSLSPASLRNLPAGYRLVLPSPNGAALSYSANHPTVLTACLRNAAAVARAASSLGRTVGVIPAGEVWEDGTLRPCIEDLIGAGAVISALIGDCSPEARLASAAFEHFQTNLGATLRARPVRS